MADDMFEFVETLPSPGFEVFKQLGPLKQYEDFKPCASRGCRVSTNYKVKGVPYCDVHALRKLNEMLLALGADSETTIVQGRIVFQDNLARCIHNELLDSICTMCQTQGWYR